MSESYHESIRNKNRNDIVAAAKEQFFKHNFLNVSIKDICNLAGVSRVTFYKHFKSLDEVIFVVQMDILKSMMDFIEASDKADESGEERLRRILYAWIHFTNQDKSQMKFIVFFDLYYEEYDSNIDLMDRYQDFVKVDKSGILDSVIRKGIEDKSFKIDLDPIKAGYYIYQTMMGVLQRMSYTLLPDNSGIVSFEDIAEATVEMIINFLKN